MEAHDERGAGHLYLRTGADPTKPVAFYGLVNERCNVECRYCEYWRLEHYADELRIAGWQRALLDIKAFVGAFSINFSGEPFIKPGFPDLMMWCRDNGIRAGVTTNGSALTRRNATRAVESRPFNVNVSVDAPAAQAVRRRIAQCDRLCLNASYSPKSVRDKAAITWRLYKG